MTVTLRSFAKINLGLRIGERRTDGFHDLLTVYQSIGLHDVIRLTVGRGSGIQIRCADPRVPTDESNTCFRVAKRALLRFRTKGRVIIDIEKSLPIQGGLGGASANAIATMLGMERAFGKRLSPAERLSIAAEVGSDLPLFLVGGTVLGVGRGEQVYPLEDFPPTACVVVTPEIGVSTPKAFAQWDRRQEQKNERSNERRQELTVSAGSDRMDGLGRGLSAWLSELHSSAPFGRGRAGNPLLELVRAGIENDFEEVVFPEYPELRESKRALENVGAKYASLSGSGSTLYGLFASRSAAARAAAMLQKRGLSAWATSTLTRRSYWRRVVAG
jgi:4-diphosphocytidyl-2-C-methyl-D-erythritol kinase